MSIFTVAEIEENIAALKCQILSDPLGTVGSFSIKDRTVEYKSSEELIQMVNFWEGQRASAASSAAGAPRINPKVARFV